MSYLANVLTTSSRLLSGRPVLHANIRVLLVRHAAAVLAAVALAACASPEPASPPAPARQSAQLDVDGRSRSYELFVPSSAQRPSPLVVVLHDAGGSSETMVEVTQFDRHASAGGFAVAYPDGIDRVWNGGFCCAGADADDVAFLRLLLDDLVADDRIDGDRVYVVGVSNGAVMAYRVGCELADRVAGVASVAGTMLTEGCAPVRPVSVLAINGTADPLVPFEGGSMPDEVGATAPAPPVAAVAAHWAEVDDCAGEPTVSSSDPVTTTTWEDCADGTEVRLVVIEGAGHTWYASEFGPVDGAIDATSEIVSFFGLAA